MSPAADFVFRLLGAVLIMALAASVCFDRRRANRSRSTEVGHNPRRCRDCAPLLHPCNRTARKALSVFPRQTRGGGQ
ncbi:membrane protein [Streptomyces phage TurkishDelight]|uniref:Membrane protein n=1 Tax=Streptomyces phage TurkishDelight TaxID=2793708 RepID=A0A7T0M111_9CAUD|nr:membrane protein [Streptomyces phage TurkishDelight]QPL14086.1 membrane protein [Streptomyces phage TurkishDelight]